MRRRIAVTAGALLMLAVGGLAASSASAVGRCVGYVEQATIVGKLTVGPGCELHEVTVEGNVVVQAGGSLENTVGLVIKGSLSAKGATGIHLLGSSVGGNVRVAESRNVSLEQSNVAGTLELVRDSGTGRIETGTVGGNLIFKEDPAEVLIADGIEIGGRLKFNGDRLSTSSPGSAGIFAEHDIVKSTVLIEGNSISAANVYLVVHGDTIGEFAKVSHNTLEGNPAFEILEDTIAGSLSCLNNAPRPTIVSENKVSGETLGQCS